MSGSPGAGGASGVVTGLGGIFFKCRDPGALGAWYAEHLGLEAHPGGGVRFTWRETGGPAAWSVWGPFPESTDYFDPSPKPYMINYRVADLDALLERLRAASERVDDEVYESEDGRFGWVMDPEGGRVELWEPAEPSVEPPLHRGPVTGLGGLFFKSDDPTALKRWYAERLGIVPGDDGYVGFRWEERDGTPGFTAWEAFPADTDYFDPSDRPFMIDFRVRGLDAALERLRASGVWVDPKVERYDYGSFGWILDPEGTRIELWEPAAETAL